MSDVFTLIALRARHGDAFFLRYGVDGGSRQRLAMIDGGPDTVFDTTILQFLERDAAEEASGRVPIDWVMVSHVDADHVVGVRDLFRLVRKDNEDGRTPLVELNALFHNTPAEAAVTPAGGPVIAVDPNDLDAVIADLAAHSGPPPALEVRESSFRQGRDLANDAGVLGIVRNPPLGRLVLAPGVLPPEVVGPVEAVVVAPTRERVMAMVTKWQTDLKDPLGGVEVQKQRDTRVENLSSIAVLLRLGGRSILLTGDCHAEDVVAGLETAGPNATPLESPLFVDVFKLPHHGSESSNTAELFERVQATNYVISADGKHRNPDVPTLTRLVASRAGLATTIWFTNHEGAAGENGQAFDSAIASMCDAIIEQGDTFVKRLNGEQPESVQDQPTWTLRFLGPDDDHHEIALLG